MREGAERGVFGVMGPYTREDSPLNISLINIAKVLLKYVWIQVPLILYLFINTLSCACLIFLPFKAYTCLFKVSVCCLYLDILLVILSCIIFNILMGYFIRRCNCQVPLYCWMQYFSCIYDIIYC